MVRLVCLHHLLAPGGGHRLGDLLGRGLGLNGGRRRGRLLDRNYLHHGGRSWLPRGGNLPRLDGQSLGLNGHYDLFSRKRHQKSQQENACQNQ